MEFSPFNHVVKLCIAGMDLENKGNHSEALKLFQQAWNEAANNFEKYLAAYYTARNQKSAEEKLKWFQTALEHGIKVNDIMIESALGSLYLNIAGCYEELKDVEHAEIYHELAIRSKQEISDDGPFYHGTKASLKNGDLLTGGRNSNYQSEIKMNHIYFTGTINGADLAAELAKGADRPRVYIVEPTGNFEHDPNVTDKKFPGNPTRSYRSEQPLRVIGEVTEWVRTAPEDLQKFRERIASSKGDIIN